MPQANVVILGWARSPVVPVGGTLSRFLPHEIGGPVVAELLRRVGASDAAVDILLAGNALGAGGNPARLVALAACLPERCGALTIDSQCCAGLDAVIVGASLIASGAAGLVVAGGVEAWSRAPLRAHRPIIPTDEPAAYERPAFAPDSSRDPDPFEAAGGLAAERRISRGAQEAFATESHARALRHREAMRAEIVSLGGLDHDPFARALTPALLARLADERGLSRVAASPKADGAAFVLLASAETARRLNVPSQFAFLGGASIGSAPEMPLLAALPACRAVLERAGTAATALWGVEIHEAFAVQALCLTADLCLDPARIGRGGGGLARGHPIGASGAVSLVRLLADLHREAPSGARGLASVAAVGGLGAAVIVERHSR